MESRGFIDYILSIIDYRLEIRDYITCSLNSVATKSIGSRVDKQLVFRVFASTPPTINWLAIFNPQSFGADFITICTTLGNTIKRDRANLLFSIRGIV